MGRLSPLDSDDTNRLLQGAADGHTNNLGEILAAHRARLRRMVAIRLDPRLRGRVDPSDVIQESQLETTRRLHEFLARPNMPFFLWLRLITGQCLAATHRRHLGTKRRDAARDISIDQGGRPQASSTVLAAKLVGRLTSPSHAAMRLEMKARLREALDAMDAVDRDVLTLRHFEHLTAKETAVELGITEEGAKKRYLRALKRLKAILMGSNGQDRDG